MLLSMHWVIDVDVMFIQITGYKQFVNCSLEIWSHILFATKLDDFVISVCSLHNMKL